MPNEWIPDFPVDKNIIKTSLGNSVWINPGPASDYDQSIWKPSTLSCSGLGSNDESNLSNKSDDTLENGTGEAWPSSPQLVSLIESDHHFLDLPGGICDSQAREHEGCIGVWDTDRKFRAFLLFNQTNGLTTPISWLHGYVCTLALNRIPCL